jgi:hypothetical protein
MDGINLNDVTAALALLLRSNVARLLGMASVEVSTLPPEKAEALADTRLNIYLHHLAHDADGGIDLPLDGSGPVPIATRPLALKLFYVITAHAVTIGQHDEDSAGQQALMGCALKTMHDFPIIDSQTRVGGTPILDKLGTRRIDVFLRPVTPEEATSFWSTDQVRTARLSAFYEVRTLLLPPEVPTMQSAAAAVLTLGVMPSPAPAITATRASTQVTLPQITGGATIRQPSAPAVVAIKTLADDDCRLVATGTGFGDGSDTVIVIRGEALMSLGLPANAAVIAPADNPAWQISVAGGQLTMMYRPVASVSTPGGPIAVAFVPGFYTLALRRTVVTASEGGLMRSVVIESNRVPFAAAPAIKAITLNAGGRVEITLAGGFDAQDPANLATLAIAGTLYQRVSALTNTPADRGNFAATAADTYIIAPLFAAPPPAGSVFAAGLSINGVNAAPAWLEVA